MLTPVKPFGDVLREWRLRRRMRQRDLACVAEISARTLSELEAGRRAPDRDLVLRLAERLSVPLRERNVLLSTAGFPPGFPERRLSDPAMAGARAGIDTVLANLEPNPAMAIDAHWYLLAANAALWRLVAGCDPMLRRPPVNALRLLLHPAGLAPRIANLVQWRTHILGRLHRQLDASGDPLLSDLIEEIQDYPVPRLRAGEAATPRDPAVAIPLQLETIDGTLLFFCVTTVFDAPLDLTLAELSIECFVAADARTRTLMRPPADAAVPAIAG